MLNCAEQVQIQKHTLKNTQNSRCPNNHAQTSNYGVKTSFKKKALIKPKYRINVHIGHTYTDLQTSTLILTFPELHLRVCADVQKQAKGCGNAG